MQKSVASDTAKLCVLGICEASEEYIGWTSKVVMRLASSLVRFQLWNTVDVYYNWIFRDFPQLYM